MQVNLPPLRKVINTAFIPSYHYKGRYLIEWGGRGSSKSVFTAKKLIIRCLAEPYFRYILFRNVYDTIRDSQWQTIKDCVNDMGLQDLFTFTTSPLKITCINGNYFVAKGGDKSEKIKSIKDPTGVWYEEDIPEEEDFYNITGSIRTTKAEYLQEVFSINPEVKGHFEDNWFWKKFFLGHHKLTFEDTTKTDIDGEIVELGYYCHHSTYHDNRFLPKEYKALLEQYKLTNPYKYIVHTLGQWGVKEIGDRFWKDFDISKHTAELSINNDLPLHISFDENTRPYPALSIWQIEDKEIRQIHEICLRTPRNKLTEVAKELIKWCKSNGWKNKFYLYGDATSDKEDTKLQKGYNYWTMLRDKLWDFAPVTLRKPTKNPPVALRAEFINSIYKYNFQGLSILIGNSCKESINDYMFAEEASDGSMKKKKNKEGIEEIGHLSDCKAYLIVEAFKNEFRIFQKGEKPATYTIGSRGSRAY
jgi:PBSX family phage terminase large subunit